MYNPFWARIHGGMTHFPIALIMASVLFDLMGLLAAGRTQSYRQGLHAAGYYTLVLAALGSFGAVISGLIMVHWTILGHGNLARHHAYVWPAFGLLVTLAVWRLIVRNRASDRAMRIYVVGALAAAALMGAAGYWGGELLLG